MKTKRRTLWTPANVKRWLEDCPAFEGQPSYCFIGWIVDSSLYCAECVHTLVENGHPLPPVAKRSNRKRGSVALVEGKLDDCFCDGCGWLLHDRLAEMKPTPAKKRKVKP